MNASRVRLLVGCLGACLGGGCGASEPHPAAGLVPLPQMPRFAVVTSDYFSTAIALLDEQGQLLTEAWIDSGTRVPGIALALSGDVVLPSEPFPGELVLVDRLGVDAVTRIELPSGRILGQWPAEVRLGGPFGANPHDVARLPDGALLVTRFEPNLDPSAPPLDAGDDVLRIDPAAGGPVARLAMPRDGPVPARPDRLAAVAGLYVVGLARLSLDFRDAAPGAVAIVNPELTRAVLVPVDGLVQCNEPRPDPRAPRSALVLCAGATFTDRAGRRTGSGIARVTVDLDAPTATVVWRARDWPDVPPPTTGLLPLPDGSVLAVAMGDAEPGGREVPDVLLRLDPTTGRAETIYEGPGAYTLGTPAFDSVGALLVLPAAQRGVVRWQWHADGLLEPLEPLDPSPLRRLPARAVGRLAPPSDEP
ncbi:MAG: hypothetical protein RMK74_16060 [Myxococcales bacterium]|nr:hypothetical protein [Myxococcales bacterium]